MKGSQVTLTSSLYRILISDSSKVIELRKQTNKGVGTYETELLKLNGMEKTFNVHLAQSSLDHKNKEN